MFLCFFAAFISFGFISLFYDELHPVKELCIAGIVSTLVSVFYVISVVAFSGVDMGSSK